MVWQGQGQKRCTAELPPPGCNGHKGAAPRPAAAAAAALALSAPALGRPAHPCTLGTRGAAPAHPTGTPCTRACPCTWRSTTRGCCRRGGGATRATRASAPSQPSASTTPATPNASSHHAHADRRAEPTTETAAARPLMCAAHVPRPTVATPLSPTRQRPGPGTTRHAHRQAMGFSFMPRVEEMEVPAVLVLRMYRMRYRWST